MTDAHKPATEISTLNIIYCHTNQFRYTAGKFSAKKRANLTPLLPLAQHIETSLTPDTFDRIADHLVTRGYIIIDDLFAPEFMAQLADYVRAIHESQFQQAGVGRGTDQQLDERIRSDQIRWLSAGSAPEAHFLAVMSALRLELNRRLFMGLFDYECHFAHYQPGDFYKRHLDAFRGRTNRILSTVLYLNADWQAEDGGQLLMYERKVKQSFLTVQPQLGRMVIFLSERFPHEVLPANRDRYSIAGWYRVNNSIGDVIDPAR